MLWVWILDWLCIGHSVPLSSVSSYIRLITLTTPASRLLTLLHRFKTQNNSLGCYSYLWSYVMNKCLIYELRKYTSLLPLFKKKICKSAKKKLYHAHTWFWLLYIHKGNPSVRTCHQKYIFSNFTIFHKREIKCWNTHDHCAFGRWEKISKAEMTDVAL